MTVELRTPPRERSASVSDGNKSPAARQPDNAAVVHCYDIVERLFPACGLTDLTEGMYLGDATLSHEVAQQNQAEWLLDQLHCAAGSRLLDIGCGNGRLLAAAQRRGASATGITLSFPQWRRCVNQGLDAHMLNYLDLDERWDGCFDCIVANGSMEHFVQPRDVERGQQEAIYRDFFQRCHKLFAPDTPCGRLAATVIHFDHFRSRPRDLRRHPLLLLPGTTRFHMAMLERVMGGFYPVEDQLVRCAAPWFDLQVQVDGTEDYRLTSETWLRNVRRGFLRPRTLSRLLRQLLPCLWQRPAHTLLALSLMFTASWQRQFRGRHPPARLLRFVWQRAPLITPAF